MPAVTCSTLAAPKPIQRCSPAREPAHVRLAPGRVPPSRASASFASGSHVPSHRRARRTRTLHRPRHNCLPRQPRSVRRCMPRSQCGSALPRRLGGAHILWCPRAGGDRAPQARHGTEPTMGASCWPPSALIAAAQSGAAPICAICPSPPWPFPHRRCVPDALSPHYLSPTDKNSCESRKDLY